MSTSITHTNEKRNDNLTLIIDKLLSKGWTSQVDMAIAINNYWEKVEDKYLYKKNHITREKAIVEYDKKHEMNTDAGVKKNDKKSDGKYYYEIRNKHRSSVSYILGQLSDIWALTHEGVNITEILDSKGKKDPKEQDHLREKYQKIFLEIDEISPSDRKEIDNHSLSKATRTYLEIVKGAARKGIKVYRYKEDGYSIKDDLKRYRKGKKIPVVKTDVPIETLGFIPDDDVYARKIKYINLKLLQEELVRSTESAVKRRLNEIEELKSSKPNGWMDETSNKYLNAIYDAEGILKIFELGKIRQLYGFHLMDRRDYPQAESTLKESLEVFSKSQTLDKKERREYALILRELADFHEINGEYLIAEEELTKTLNIYKDLSKSDNSYLLLVAYTLNHLANLHISIKKLGKDVEEEILEALQITEQLDPETQFLPNTIFLTSLAVYDNAIGKREESIELFELVMENWKVIRRFFIQEKGDFKEIAPHYCQLLSYFSRALADNGDLKKAEEMLQERLELLWQLEEESPGVYKNAISTTYVDLGQLLLSFGDMVGSEKNLIAGEKILRELAFINPCAYNEELAIILDTQVQLLISAEKYQAAVEKGKEALSLLEEYDCEGEDKFAYEIGMFTYNIGDAYWLMGDKENAISYMEKAESAFRQLFDRDTAAKMCEIDYVYTLLALCELYNSIKEKKNEVDGKYRECLDVALWFTSRFPQTSLEIPIMVYNRYGLYLAQKGKYDKAKQMLKKALRIGEQASLHPTKEVQESIALSREILQTIEEKESLQSSKNKRRTK